MNAQYAPKLGSDIAALPLKNQQEVNTLEGWYEDDSKAAERSRRLRNLLGGTALAGYGVLAAIHYGEGVALSDLTTVSAGLGVLMNSATRKHGDAALNRKMAERSAEQVVNITEHTQPDESNEDVETADELADIAA